ncbi:MAG: ElyC/SanA/YdcF family protein [Lachnospiraceae bacterium]|nr:ElyC/SanA/YdcF family protein [Lachnospiraceae bacterium]
MKKDKRLFARIFRDLVCVVLFVILVSLLGNVVVIGTTRNLIKKETAVKNQNADCILVLGAGVKKDNSPSLMLRDRLDRAIKLYKDGAAPKLLMSGDHGRKNYDEVQVMKDYAIEQGVPSSDIFMDHAGFSTYDSMYRAKSVFQVKNMIVVSQKYHLYRALYSAKGLGVKATGIPAKEVRYNGQLYRDLREVLARDKDIVTVLSKKKPKYLGDIVPITGDGDVTNDQ